MKREVLTQLLLDRCTRDASVTRQVDGLVMHVRKGRIALTSAAGDMTVSSRFFLMSVTKLFVTAVIMKLVSDGRFALDDRIASFLPRKTVEGLHVRDGVDRSDSIEIVHLLSNTSGIPDYFDEKVAEGLRANVDQVWDMESVLSVIGGKSAGFNPGQKAEYCDTNFLLLGAVIESAAGKPVGKVFDEMIIRPLALNDTYLYKGEPDGRLSPMHHENRILELPRFLTSLGARGGIVSTAQDLGLFLEAFFGGTLFGARKLEALRSWRPLPGPGMLEYGTGILKQPLSILSPGKELHGHWGHSGAFAFLDPESGTYVSGTVNSLFGHSRALGAIMSVLRYPLAPGAVGGDHPEC